MIIGLISDAHGNIYGLEKAVRLLEERHSERIFFLGDAINYFGRGKEVVRFLENRNICCIKGNHEIMLLENIDMTPSDREIFNIDHTKETFEKKDFEYVGTWADHIAIEINGLRILMVHASPFDHFWEYVYPNTPLHEFAELPYDVIFLGHTHIPFLRELNGKIIVNVGSVGLPRDDGRFISCCLFDAKERKATILRDNFPHEALPDLKPFSPRILRVLERRSEKAK